jgi:proline iminopeptidase
VTVGDDTIEVTAAPARTPHGGPDVDSAYLLPDLDRLANSRRLIYYDQRGRGRSAEGVLPGDVTVASDLEDLDAVRKHFNADAPVLLAHSWGTVLRALVTLRNCGHFSYLECGSAVRKTIDAFMR